VWVTLELLPPALGFDDTDNPAVSLDYLRQYPQFYLLAGATVFIMAIANIVASFAVRVPALAASRRDPLKGLRVP
jgi:hypothetical protein